MTNPFENEEYDYQVLLNKESEHSLWPAFREVPAGWTVIGPTGKRQESSNGSKPTGQTCARRGSSTP
jgi:MbtH protein